MEENDNKKNNTPDDLSIELAQDTPEDSENSENLCETDDFLLPEFTPEQKAEAEQHFKECVAKLKSEHPGDIGMVNLLTDSLVVRAVAAWPNVERDVLYDATRTENPWAQIWYAAETWMMAARIPKDHREGVRVCVIQNHLVYPDGDIPQPVKAFLAQAGRDLLGLPQRGGR